MLGTQDLKAKKYKKEPITMLTAYDYFTAKLVQEANIDTILIGDSLGMVFKGDQSTLQVTVDDVIYHCKAVRKGADKTFIIGDLPYMSYHLDIEQTKLNASRFIIEGNANAVKLEGGSESRVKAIEAIVDCEIPVVAHLGLTPQSINRFGGYKVQGKDEAAAEVILEQAKNIEQAGAFMLILEAIPEKLGKIITEALSIPVIGIGAGRFTDGQVLVVNDILGLSETRAKFAKVYKEIGSLMLEAISSYRREVEEGRFPASKNVYHPIEKSK